MRLHRRMADGTYQAIPKNTIYWKHPAWAVSHIPVGTSKLSRAVVLHRGHPRIHYPGQWWTATDIDTGAALTNASRALDARAEATEILADLRPTAFVARLIEAFEGKVPRIPSLHVKGHISFWIIGDEVRMGHCHPDQALYVWPTQEEIDDALQRLQA